MKHEMTRCPTCHSILVAHDTVHAVDGHLFCSRECAIQHMTSEYIQNAKEMAIEAYASNAEIVATEDILSEDLQEIKVTITCSAIFKMPKNMSEEEAVEAVRQMYDDSLIQVNPEECDELTFTCELVKDDNSAHSKEV